MQIDNLPLEFVVAVTSHYHCDTKIQGEKNMRRTLPFLVCAICLLSLVAACAKAEKPLIVAELLDFGEKYLLEIDYEQAIVQFTKVIEIEPMNVRGYTGMAEAYLALDQTDMAKSVLEQGLDMLGENESIVNMLEGIRKAEEAAHAELRK